MTTSSFGLRQIAYTYCQSVSHLFEFLGLDGYQIILTFVLLAFLCGIGFLASGRARDVVNRLCPPWLYCLFLISTLFIARLPAFLPDSMNPDEGMFLAGAMKLRRYPVFWQSLDGATSGPLNYYPLALLNILGLPLDFATARLLNVICIGSVIVLVYVVARLFLPDWAARLTALPPLAAATEFRAMEFLHYSSECIPALLIAVGVWLLFAENLSNRTNWLRSVGIGIIPVLLPLAKLQAAPMAATILVGGLANALFWRREHKWRGVFYISAGLAGGIATLLVFLVGFGVFGTFRQAYITENILHANMFPPLSFERFLEYCVPPDLRWYEGGILAFLIYSLGSSYHLWTRREGNPVAKLSFSGSFIVLILVATLYAVYRPHRQFYHYLVFLIFPLALLGAGTLASSLSSAKDTALPGSHPPPVRAAILFALLTLVLPCLLRGIELRTSFEFKSWMTAYSPKPACPACQLIQHFAKAGDPIAIWGWAPELYVLTGAIPSTHDTHMPLEFMTLPQQDYYRGRFLEDLQQHPPRVFVDAVGPGEFSYQDRDSYGFETFPELRQYVATNYYLVGDTNAVSLQFMRGATTGQVRVFVRKDPSEEMRLPFRIKCGSDSMISDESGHEWKPDAYFEGGRADQIPPSEDTTELSPLYRSERVCSAKCKYFIPIQNGDYLVRLYFAELTHSGANQRLFDVEVNQDAITLDLDLFQAAHGRANPYVLERRTTVSDQGLQISLIPKLGAATINAIEILPAVETPASNFQYKEITESETGPLIDQVKWKADPAWTLNSHYPDVGDLSSGEMWSSYGGDDKKTGRIIAGPLAPSPAGCLVLPIAHGPSVDHLSVIFLDVPSGQQIGLVPLDPTRRRWQLYEIRYSPAATVRVVATDRGAGWGQWLGVGQPRSCK